VDWVDCERIHVGICQTGIDGAPGPTAVRAFKGAIKGARIEGGRVDWVNGQEVDDATFRSNACPGGGPSRNRSCLASAYENQKDDKEKSSKGDCGQHGGSPFRKTIIFKIGF
jgi:hypothetical protein